MIHIQDSNEVERQVRGIRRIKDGRFTRFSPQRNVWILLAQWRIYNLQFMFLHTYKKMHLIRKSLVGSIMYPVVFFMG